MSKEKETELTREEMHAVEEKKGGRIDVTEKGKE